jgi:hypothetical protein
MRQHGIWAITCRCGWAPMDLRDTIRELICPECGRRLEIEFDRPVVVEAGKGLTK